MSPANLMRLTLWVGHVGRDDIGPCLERLFDMPGAIDTGHAVTERVSSFMMFLAIAGVQSLWFPVKRTPRS